MFRSRVSYGFASLTLAGIAIGATGSAVLAESRKPARLITEAEVKEIMVEAHSQDKYTYTDLSELAALGEDGTCQGVVGNYRCWGIFDGHSGWSTSNHVSNNIVSYLNNAYDKQKGSGSLSPLKWIFSDSSKGDDNKEPSPEQFDEIISEAFTTLDNDIIQAPLKALKAGDAKLAAEALPVALSGSCAMMTFYNPLQHLLKVALVGDSRTVFGYQDKDGVWHANSLTVDQTGGNPDEIARIRAAHPKDPPEIVRNGRVLGYQPSRSFGDGTTKYTKDQAKQLRNKFWMRTPSALDLSPPYLTAQPVISTIKLDPTRPSFMVMGCDGLYEWLSNEQLVSLVGQWLEKNPVIATKKFAGVRDHSKGYDSATFKRPQELGWGPLKPVVKDDNAATHVIRNALGGADFQKVSLLMSIPSPMSRRYRDDITCTVVFFIPEEVSKL